MNVQDLLRPGPQAAAAEPAGQVTGQRFVLTLRCPDRRGIVHAVSSFLSERFANIDEAAQFNDPDTRQFFMRVCFVFEERCMQLDEIRADFAGVGQDFAMEWTLVRADAPMRTILMVSKLGHCLHDLLLRWRTGLLPVDVCAVVSNHRDWYQLAASYGIPFHHLPVTPDTKSRAEARLLEVMGEHDAQLVVLARYMQVLSAELCEHLSGRAINIHHGFLPGFKGARPYDQAHARGVKLIGATAHYVTADLDEGPIIEQDVVRADHAMCTKALTSLGRDVESVVLARAVKWHAERRVVMNGSRTVVFR